LGIELSDHIAGLRAVPWVVPLDGHDVGFCGRIYVVCQDQLTRPHDGPALWVAAKRVNEFVEVIAEQARLIEWVRQGCSGLRELDRGSRR